VTGGSATRRLTRRRGDRCGGRDEWNGPTVCPDRGKERADGQDTSPIGCDNAADREDIESDHGGRVSGRRGTAM
jgi:hypothetical protein